MAYTTISGDTWDVIAKKVYGDEYCADLLMAANPWQLGVFVFGSGVQLETPEKTMDQTAQLPPWKR